MNAKEFMQDAIEAPFSINHDTARRIRFHARSCHHAGRTEYIMLRQVARVYGYTLNVLDIARFEWFKIEQKTIPEVLKSV